VEDFRQIEVKGDGSALGAVAGGATGALIGHQFGRGTGKDLLTIAGAVGGAFAGHEIEKNVRKKTRYEISVRMEDGSTRTLSQDAAPAWRIGDHVRVINNQLVAAS
jgi:outer membrane lipoprotein SlyB